MTAPTPTAPESLMEFKQRMMVMRLIHTALVAGLVMFGLVVVVISKGRLRLDPSSFNPVVLVSGILTVSGIAVASVFKRFFRAQADKPTDPVNALQKYQALVLARAAIIEGSALFSAVAVLITRNSLPGIAFVACVIAMLFFRPSQEEFVELFGPRKP